LLNNFGNSLKNLTNLKELKLNFELNDLSIIHLEKIFLNVKDLNKLEKLEL
jgi:hypothetical protein